MSSCGYDFYMDKCLLPVTPEKLQIKINNANKTTTLINEGEINLLKTAKLSEIEFDCKLPQVEYPFARYVSGFQAAECYLNYFERLKIGKSPFQFIVCRHMPDGKKLFNTNIKVSLEDYKITESAKDGFDVSVKIKLKQYRDFSAKTVNISVVNSRARATVQETRADGQSKPIGIGTDVIVNGRLHRDSFGNGPGQTRTNYRGKVNFIKLGRSHPYHVTEPSGGWLGWVTADSVKGA